eukprot:1937722-Pyramimonas_sp.AAC.1
MYPVRVWEVSPLPSAATPNRKTFKCPTHTVPELFGPLIGIPTVADTKDKFIKAYPKPIPAVYNTVLQEMIVLQHMSRYQKDYKYTA